MKAAGRPQTQYTRQPGASLVPFWYQSKTLHLPGRQHVILYPTWQWGQKCADRPPITMRSTGVSHRRQGLPPRP